MALNSNSLATVLQNSVTNLTNYIDFWSNFCNDLNKYLSSFYELNGIYTGVVNGTSSALNGPYLWTGQFNCIGANIASAVYNSTDYTKTISTITAVLKTEIIKQIVIPQSGPVILDGVKHIACNSIVFDFSSHPDNPTDTHLIYSNGIVNAIKSAIPSPISAKGSDGSIGIVSFSNQN